MSGRGSRYRDDWGKDLRRDDLAVRVHPRDGTLGTVKGAGRPAPGARPIRTIADVERHLQITGIHVTRPKRDRELERRRRSETIEDRDLRRALGLRGKVTVGDDQPRNAVTIHQILALPDYALGGRRIDRVALRKDWARGVARAHAAQARRSASDNARIRDAEQAAQFGLPPAGEAWRSTGVYLLELVYRMLGAKPRRRR